MFATLEVDLAVFLLVPAADMTRGQAALVVAAAAAFLHLGQRMMRLRLGNFGKGRERFETLRRGKWAICSDGHN